MRQERGKCVLNRGNSMHKGPRAQESASVSFCCIKNTPETYWLKNHHLAHNELNNCGLATWLESGRLFSSDLGWFTHTLWSSSRSMNGLSLFYIVVPSLAGEVRFVDRAARFCKKLQELLWPRFRTHITLFLPHSIGQSTFRYD